MMKAIVGVLSPLHRPYSRLKKATVGVAAMASGLLASLPAWPESPGGEPLEISVAAPEYWCPYACDSGQRRSGFAVDIARAALESEGHRVLYRNLPYGRAIREAEEGRIDAIVPAFRQEAPNFIFPPSAVSLTEYCFYVREDDPRRYDGLDSLEDMRFVATSGYTYGATMDAYIANHLKEKVTLIRGSDVSNRLRELVKIGRYDALLDDRLLFESSQNSVGLVNAGCLDERHPGYLALSPEDAERSNVIARAFERGLNRIRDNGKLCGILDEYEQSSAVVPELQAAHCGRQE
ncbi:MAG: transporter substrate-binding domain-containing protein [Pseudomonadota bacterium]|nr:transporter substrate-binding domain-containing protein [Pseudomonadota bacterium]